MLHQDYLMRMIMNLVLAIRRSLEQAEGDRDPMTAAETLEMAIGEATDIDGSVLLSLSPDSIASILVVSGTDPSVIEYLSRSMLLTARYYADAGREDLAALREGQARAIAEAYGCDLDAEMLSPDELEALFDEFDSSK